MMAWVRTATSLITFGFTVYKFFQLQRYGDFERRHRVGPREFGLTLVSIGLISLILAAWDNRQNMTELRAQYPQVPYSKATALGALIFALGIAGLIVIILRE
jgi:putative membrane protein